MMDYRIYSEKLPYQKNALRVEAIVSGARCALLPYERMKELLKTRWAAVMSNPSIHWVDFAPCDKKCICADCPIATHVQPTPDQNGDAAQAADHPANGV